MDANRRTILTGAVGVSSALAAGCGGGEAPPYGGGTPTIPETSPTEAADGGVALAKVADVPVGGGLVLAAEKVVLTQPVEGTIKGFSSICTHHGCTLADVDHGTINCGCHGSKFDPATGAVRHGPATTGLPEVEVRVEGGEISRVASAEPPS
ncbi:MAG: Rieske (2Fe-2S) protein [Micromonosporaceae bacterium]